MRNIVNFKEIETLLSSYREKFKDFPLMIFFVDHNFKNFLYREAPVVEDLEFANRTSLDPLLTKIRDKGGPFHKVVLSPTLLSTLETQINAMFMKVALKEYTSQDHITSSCQFSINWDTIPLSNLTYKENGIKIFHLLNAAAVSTEGHYMKNCLRHTSTESFNKYSTTYYYVENENQEKVAIFNLNCMGSLAEIKGRNNTPISNKKILSVVKNFSKKQKEKIKNQNVNFQKADAVLTAVYLPILSSVVKTMVASQVLNAFFLSLNHGKENLLTNSMDMIFDITAWSLVVVMGHIWYFLVEKKFLGEKKLNDFLKRRKTNHEKV